jgi:hypothetical protein
VLFQLAGDVVLETESAVALLAGYPPETLDAYDAGPSSGLDCVGPAEIGLHGRLTRKANAVGASYRMRIGSTGRPSEPTSFVQAMPSPSPICERRLC